MSLIKIIELDQRGDERGYLTVIDEINTIPFEVKRVYFLTSLSKDIPRGYHAHKTLEQFALCVAGSCKVLLDDGENKEWVTLDTPNKGLRIEPLIWHEMHEFSEDCVFLVLANDFYDESDYIRNYSEFLERLKNEL